MEKKKRIVIALGGNALGNTLPEQMAAVKITAVSYTHLDVYKRQVVNPSAFSAAVSFTSVFRRTSTPIFSRSAASLSIDVPGILNSGITWRTTPPRASFFSNTVTAIPALRRK